jgi:glycerol-3-phosphate dehydrogenase (NAD(P)+)
MWVYEREVAEAINTDHVNPLFLPGIPLPVSITASNDMARVVKDVETLVMVVPSHFYRRVTESLVPLLAPSARIVSAAKGIEENSLKLMTQILEEILPAPFHERIACLSGPSFAREVAQEKFTAVTMASASPPTAKYFQAIFTTPYFRVYTHHDPIGVQLGGALKNIMAIAVGIADGLEMGTNARAALITRGLTEISRIGRKMGADPSTFLGLSGMGDLVLTCTGDLSRNRNVGLKLGRGQSIDEIVRDMKMIAEGVLNTKSAYQLTRKLDVRAPIITGMYQILYEKLPLGKAVTKILSTEPKGEFEPRDP